MRVIKRIRPTKTLLHHSTEILCGTEAGSYLRLIDSCIAQLKAQGPSRTCNESKEEEESKPMWTHVSGEAKGASLMGVSLFHVPSHSGFGG